MMFKTIRFTPNTEWYYPKSIELGVLENAKNYVEHTQIDFQSTCSRIGGPIIDLPKKLQYPKDMFFVAQLNLVEFAQHDSLSLLPKSGFLYFFINGDGDDGSVCYADVSERELIREVKEHDGWFWDGCLINSIFVEEEDFDARYIQDDEEDDESENEVEKGMVWDYFAGSEKSKIYGIYTHCQKQEEEIREISTDSNNVLLLQIGEDFTGEGVWSVLINRDDLLSKKFERCKFEWGQS
jgi:uncharacterized protein YwqG